MEFSGRRILVTAIKQIRMEETSATKLLNFVYLGIMSNPYKEEREVLLNSFWQDVLLETFDDAAQKVYARIKKESGSLWNLSWGFYADLKRFGERLL